MTISAILRRVGNLRLVNCRLFSFDGRLSLKSHYETLGVSVSASKKEIREGYIKKSKLCHPDLNPSDESLHKKFLAVQEAYDVLSCDVKKREYDFDNVPSRPRPTTSSSSQYDHLYNRQSASWNAKDDNFGEKEKGRAFWTDPEYRKQHRNATWTPKERNRLFTRVIFSWLVAMSLCVYAYTSYIMNQKEALTRRQQVMSQYRSIRTVANSRSSAETMEAMKSSMIEGKDTHKTNSDGKDDWATANVRSTSLLHLVDDCVHTLLKYFNDFLILNWIQSRYLEPLGCNLGLVLLQQWVNEII